MSLLSGNLILDLLGIIIALWAVIYTYFYWGFKYWERLNVPYIQPQMIWGNLGNRFEPKEAFPIKMKKFYDEFKSRGVKYGGIYFLRTPQFVPIDLDLIKNILIKDFDHFVDRGFEVDEENEPLQQHLFNLGGSKWRTLRNKLSPTFTSGKMKMMFETLVGCTPFMVEKIGKNITEPIDIKEILSCYGTDVIGSCAFGLECNSFGEEDSPFRKYGRDVFKTSRSRRVKGLVKSFFPYLGRRLKIKVTPYETENFFMDLVKKMQKYREENNVKRNDFLQLLFDFKDELTFEEIAAQCFIFFLAGFETSSSTMTFVLYILSKHTEIQERLRSEINEVLRKHDNKLTYDAISEMKYLTQVVDETLRLYPPLGFLNRCAVKDYKIPGDSLVLKKGTKIIISTLGIQHDKDYYPDPEKFDPERFNDQNRKKSHPCSFLPFGDGPRNCIGLRFGLMQTKVGLTSLLTKFRFTINPKTQEPIQMDPNLGLLSVHSGLWLNAEKV